MRRVYIYARLSRYALTTGVAPELDRRQFDVVFTCTELTQQASYGGGYTIIDVKTTFASTLSCSRELDELVSNSLAVKLEEIPLVLRRRERVRKCSHPCRKPQATPQI